MVAPNKSRRVVCTLVRVAEAPLDAPVRFVRKPSALVPWADPYIAGLVRRLQCEVRMERAALAGTTAARQPSTLPAFSDRGAALCFHASPAADLDPPSPCDSDWDFNDAPCWTHDEETLD
jgi:hypothetical protein